MEEKRMVSRRLDLVSNGQEEVPQHQRSQSLQRIDCSLNWALLSRSLIVKKCLKISSTVLGSYSPCPKIDIYKEKLFSATVCVGFCVYTAVCRYA